MPRPNRTSIEIAHEIRAVYDRLTRRYGIRNAISAGLLLLDRLTPAEREKVIDETKRLASLPVRQTGLREALAVVKRAAAAELPGATVKILSSEDAALLDSVRQMLEAGEGTPDEEAADVIAAAEAATEARRQRRHRKPSKSA